MDMLKYYTDDIQYNVDKLKLEIVTINKELSALKAPLGQIQPLKKFNLYNTRYERENINTIKQWYDEDCKTWEENENIVKQNKSIIDLIISIAVGAGIKESEYKYKTSRRTSGSWVATTWKTALLSQLPINWSKYELDRLWKEAKEKHDKAEQAKKAAEKAEIDAANAEQNKIEKMKVLVTLALKYEIEVPNTVTEMVEILRTKDKYLDLAIAMSDTRGDWNDGFWRVEEALNRFKPESAEDFLVFENVSDTYKSDERDGRIFRDCKYNYDILFNLVDKNIYDDYNKLSEYRFSERW